MANKPKIAHIAPSKFFQDLAAAGGNAAELARRYGVHKAQTHRYIAKHGYPEWYGTGTIDAGVLAEQLEPRREAPEFMAGRAQRYVLTAAVNATPVHQHFLATLEAYCAHRDAQLLVVPLRYKNPTSVWTNDQENDDWWAPEVAKYLVDKRMRLAKGLVLLGDIKVQPTASNPLQGLDGLTGGDSAVLAHPQVALTTVPTPQNELPKIMATTGAVTRANYTASKAGARGEFNHSFAAVVVEVEASGTFHLRHLSATDDGAFHDLEYAYDGDTVRREDIAALVLGDLHVDFIDPSVDKATFDGSGSMAARLNPQLYVLHDTLDCYSVSHHHKHDPIIRYAKHHAKRDNVQAEIERVFAFVDARVPRHAQPVFVSSNHHDHLGKWVRETDPRHDPENAVIWATLYKAMCENAKMTPSGTATIDPFVWLAKQLLKCSDRAIFLGRGESFAVHGIELSMHGDVGPNGARGSRKALDRIGTRSVIGHSHSPGIVGGCYQTGTSSRYALEYAVGPSSWLHTHCVVYKNGKRALLNIINGRWTA